MGPSIDIIIPVHTPDRKIERAVGSVLAYTQAAVRVIVVIHNAVPGGVLDRLADWRDDPRLLVRELVDGLSSPAGPMNLGLERSDADFVAFMGSDDALEPGAIDAWLEVQRETGASVVIAPMRDERGRMIATPPARIWRTRRLRLDRDRLAYRAAPLGLVCRKDFGDLRFSPGLRSGEDIAYTLRLWGSGCPIAFPRKAPAYLVHDDAGDRVTFSARSVSEDFAFLEGVLADPEIVGLGFRDRQAIAVKIVRAHVFDAVRNREASSWSLEERAELARVCERLLDWMPSAEQLLSLNERALLDVILDPERSAEELNRASLARRRYFSLPAVLTRNPLFLMHRQSPLRFGIATVLLSLR